MKSRICLLLYWYKTFSRRSSQCEFSIWRCWQLFFQIRNSFFLHKKVAHIHGPCILYCSCFKKVTVFILLLPKVYTAMRDLCLSSRKDNSLDDGHEVLIWHKMDILLHISHPCRMEQNILSKIQTDIVNMSNACIHHVPVQISNDIWDILHNFRSNSRLLWDFQVCHTKPFCFPYVND